jgi:hypothetical protein
MTTIISAKEVLTMAWEMFKRRTRPSPKDPMVTLSKSGMIGLNAAITRNVLGDNRFAHLLFDKEKHLIGIKFLKTSDQDAYPVKCTKTMSHGTIAGVSFLKTYRIFPSETTAYRATFDDSGKILIVDISGMGDEKAGAKRKAKLS